ncbi:MAG TPA: ribosome-associated translation inhibitor RaiA [Candidatus Saccharimonadales bacterium]|nr:ribosome-associated translation inhibitor RaiA [Candidatus Saccharimonadales bacterium]
MIKLQTTGRHFELDAKIMEYIEKKIGNLDKFLPRGTGEVSGSVILELDESHTADSQCISEIEIDVKGERMHAREETVNMYAAIDICEQKLKAQILRYKSKHEPAKNRRRKLFAKMLGREPIITEE